MIDTQTIFVYTERIQNAYRIIYTFVYRTHTEAYVYKKNTFSQFD